MYDAMGVDNLGTFYVILLNDGPIMREMVFPERNWKYFVSQNILHPDLNSCKFHSKMQKYTHIMQFSFVCAKVRNVYCTGEMLCLTSNP